MGEIIKTDDYQIEIKHSLTKCPLADFRKEERR
jgi:hypothetical protein